ncbi:MAG: putative Zn-dependent peptidase [Halieaceae bacterium]|jgi:predicted Zn-dependent peptidase
MRKLLFGLTLLLGGMSVSQAQQKIKYVEYDLPNGLHVILHEDHSTPIVAVSVMYHVGSKNEDSTRTGFAHFFEHLMFEGSENIPRGEYSNYVEKAGGALNANTSQDRTFYYDLLPSNQLELGLWLESERMMHAKVDSTGIATQREVVKEEKRQRVDNQPYGSFQAEIMKRAYTVHPYRWTPIGSMADLDAAEEADYVNFYKKFYVPNNACLSIAGDLDIKETKKMINEYFSDIPKGADIVRPTIVEPMKTAQVRDTIYDNIQLPGVMMAFHSPALGTDDGYAMDMVSKILSQGSSSRLHKRIVEDEQKAVFVGAFPFPLEDPGVFIALSIANSGVQPDEVETSIMEEITKLQNELISESEFQKLQNQIENDIVSGYSSQAGIAENLAQYYMYYGSTKLINTEIKKYRAVTRDAIMAVAKKYLIANNSVVLYYFPKQ